MQLNIFQHQRQEFALLLFLSAHLKPCSSSVIHPTSRNFTFCFSTAAVFLWLQFQSRYWNDYFISGTIVMVSRDWPDVDGIVTVSLCHHRIQSRDAGKHSIHNTTRFEIFSTRSDFFLHFFSQTRQLKNFSLVFCFYKQSLVWLWGCFLYIENQKTRLFFSFITFRKVKRKVSSLEISIK